MVLGGTQTPAQIYRMHGANSPKKLALVQGDRRFTFGELDRAIDATAHALQRRGFGRTKSLVLFLKNRPEFLVAHAGATRLGAPGVATSWRGTAPELAYLAGHAGAHGIVFDRELYPVVEEAVRTLPDLPRKNLFVVGGDVPGCTPFEALVDEGQGHGEYEPKKGAVEDAAVVIYTSGTTGKPKGAVRKFPRNSLATWMQFLAETPLRTDDVHLAVCPLYHSTGFAFLSVSHILGAQVVLLEDFKAEAFVETVARHRVTTTAVVPTMLHRVLSLGAPVLDAHDASSLRVVFAGGAPLPGPLALEFMDRFGDILFNFYGATETGLVTLGKPADLRAAPGTIGPALPGNEIHLLDDAGAEVGPGEVGELFVRNKTLVEGYHRDEAATRASMKEGSFSVGDLARKDGAGRYFIEGRKRDMIISGGVNVYPAEVESVFEAHPDVAEVAVVGAPDPEWGERVRAFVVLRSPGRVGEDDLRTWAKARLSGPKVPRDYVFLDVLPRNPTGKVLKRELRGMTAPIDEATPSRPR